jgi:fido (protein-threonine AMPylation protein)
MKKPLKRPADEQELKQREAAGLWAAIALSRKLAEDRGLISLENLKRIHQQLLGTSNPEAAGRFRHAGEDVKKLACLEPPPGVAVTERFHSAWGDFECRLAKIPLVHPTDGEGARTVLEEIFDLATWGQYQIAATHPFCDGNGRMARLVTNMVLIRFGLPPSRVKYEGEDKNRYLNALCQIDRHGDYELLKQLILSGSLETLEKEEKRRREAQQAG